MAQQPPRIAEKLSHEPYAVTDAIERIAENLSHEPHAVADGIERIADGERISRYCVCPPTSGNRHNHYVH